MMMKKLMKDQVLKSIKIIIKITKRKRVVANDYFYLKFILFYQ